MSLLILVLILGPPSNSDRPSSVKGDASSTTKRYIPESTQHEHQLGMKLTIEQLKKRCNLTDEQLQRAIRDGELFNVAYLFEGWSEYVDTPGLGLTRGEQAQIRSDLTLVTNVMRMKEALRIWKSKNPFAATFLSLLNILLALKTQGDLARKICEHLKIGGRCSFLKFHATTLQMFAREMFQTCTVLITLHLWSH